MSARLSYLGQLENRGFRMRRCPTARIRPTACGSQLARRAVMRIARTLALMACAIFRNLTSGLPSLRCAGP